jgi:thymidylate synthase
MGIRIHPKTYQDKYVADDPEFETRELQDYIYMVTEPRLKDIDAIQPYCEIEWDDRLRGILGAPLNPGTAWLMRKEIWEQFLEKDGKFAYTYAERLASHNTVMEILNRIREDPDSRQLFISIWHPSDIEKLGGLSRIPCSLGYQIQIRKDKLNLTYLQRSCDFSTHLRNDIWLAVMMQRHLSEQTGYPMGKFTHWIGSLHIFKKDMEGVF